MYEGLEQAAASQEDLLQRAEQSCLVVRDKIDELKKFIVDYTFKDIGEEVHFFKEVKPKFVKELIYYSEVFEIESNKPIGSGDIQRSYYLQELERMRIFFERNQSLYIYYRTKKTIYDELFFLRERKNDMMFTHSLVEIDGRFSTVQSFKLSKLQAYESLRHYVQQCILRIDSPDISEPVDNKNKKRRSWTDSKSALIELAFAIHSRGSVNNGRGDLKELVNDLELFFDVELGNFYRTLASMRIRKKSRTVYLDVLKDTAERKMDDTDMNFA